ncbi:MAG: transporter substrate-binding domain-containing protein [Pseudomonadota bacterium]
MAICRFFKRPGFMGAPAAVLVLGYSMTVAGLTHAQQTKPLDCAVVAHFPPFIISQDGALTGISVEILRIAAQRSGRAIVFEEMPFQRALHRVTTQNDCMMPALFRTAPREDQFLWLATYDAAELHFLTIGSPINTLDEGRTLSAIGVVKDSSGDTVLTSLGFENLVRVASSSSNARMLHAGRIDAWVQSERAARSIWAQLGMQTALQAGDPIHSVPMYAVAGPEFPDDVADLYRTAIMNMVEDGTVAGIFAEFR